MTKVERVPERSLTLAERAEFKRKSDAADYMLGYQIGRDLGSGDTGATILAAVALVAVLAVAFSGETPGVSYQTVRHQATEEYGSAHLVLRGTARATSPTSMDHGRTLRILVPADTRFHGQTAAGSGLAAANATAEVLNAAGWKTEVVRSAGGGGYVLKPSLIRWADRSQITLDMNKDVATVEYELLDDSRTLQRFVVHGAEGPISMKQGGTPADVLKPAFKKHWAVYTR